MNEKRLCNWFAQQIEFKEPEPDMKAANAVYLKWQKEKAKEDEHITQLEDPHKGYYYNQPEGQPMRTVEQCRESVLEKINHTRRCMRKLVREETLLLRPHFFRFLVGCSEFVDEIENDERKQCEEIGLDYQPGSFVTGLRKFLASLERSYPATVDDPRFGLDAWGFHMCLTRLAPWSDKWADPVPEPDKHEERMKAKRLAELERLDALKPANEVSPAEQAKRAAAIDAEKAKLRAS